MHESDTRVTGKGQQLRPGPLPKKIDYHKWSHGRGVPGPLWQQEQVWSLGTRVS